MHVLAAQLKKNELEKHLGSRYSVLWERQISQKSGLWSGYTPHYHKIVSSDGKISEAKIAEVRVEQVSQDGLSLVNNARQMEVNLTFL